MLKKLLIAAVLVTSSTAAMSAAPSRSDRGVSGCHGPADRGMSDWGDEMGFWINGFQSWMRYWNWH